jgi:Ca2+-binding RTX toxin-like protein
MRADIARNDFGVDGSGVTIGALSDSYNNRNGAGRDIFTGDIPGFGNPLGNTTPVNVVADLFGGGSDEGRAMLQLIHDVAPKADLSFYTAFNGQADFANGIIALANEGADVIVDDVIYFAEPFFQDGIIAQAVDQVVDQGVSYFSSAGNSATQSYESAFRASTVSGAYLFHDFDPGTGVDITQNFTLNPRRAVLLTFQWDQPHASSGGIGSRNDLDIFLVDSSGTIVANGSNGNINGDPVEILFYQNNTSSPQNLFLQIGQYLPSGGPTPGLIKYVDFAGETSNAQYFTNSPTNFGHANADGATAVGAAFYRDTPEFGTNPPELEPFSSRGGTPILFNTSGNRLASPVDRKQPSIVAPDGTNTTFFGSDVDGDGFPNFFGTSAAAPHAAAVAGLLKQAKPNATPTQIYAALEQSAIDMKTPGFDRDSGFGLIQADAALDIFANVTLPTITLAVSPSAVTEDGTGNLTYTFTRTGNLTNALRVNYRVGGTATNGIDYGTIGTSLNFAANSGTATVIVDPTPDTTVEPNETVTLTLASNRAYTIGTTTAVTGTITNDDVLPRITLAVSPFAVREDGTGNLTYTFTRTGTLTNALRVNYRVGGTATNGTDYRNIGTSVNFAANSATARVIVNPTPDTIVEPDETVSLTLVSNRAYTIGTPSAVTGTITNDDLTGTPGRDNLIGTPGNDTIIASSGGDILTGNGGNDTFVYNRLINAGDTITDFTPRQDLLNIRGLLQSIEFRGTNPLTEEYITFSRSGTNTLLNIDPDGPNGSGSARAFILLEDVTVVAMNNSNNFIF